MDFGNRRWPRVHTKPSTLCWSVVQTNDTTHFQKPRTANLKFTVKGLHPIMLASYMQSETFLLRALTSDGFFLLKNQIPTFSCIVDNHSPVE